MERDLTDLESFVVYEDPKIVDGSRRRPFTRRDPVVEQFFHTLPGIAQSVYLERLGLMDEHLKKLRERKNRITSELARLAGLERAPKGLVEGYEDRIDFLTSLLAWMKRQPPVQLDKLVIWEESSMKLRLQKFEYPNLRLDPETGEMESRIKLNWRMFREYRRESMNLTLDFDLGINLRTLNGYYDPGGFIQWKRLNRRNLRVLRLEYPIIVSQELRDDPSRGIATYASVFGQAIESIYEMLTDIFFSDLSDLHGLYILVRGSLFAEEWGQLANTSLARGLAAYLSFRTLEGEIGAQRLNEILEHDWTIWNLRQIGAEFDDLNWENYFQPLMKHGRHKEMPRMETIFWSTRFVYYLMEEFGPDFPERIFAQLRGEGRKGSGLDFQHEDMSKIKALTPSYTSGDMSKSKGLTPTEGDVFRLVTGEDLGEVMDLARARWHIRLRPLGLRRDREGTEAQRGRRRAGARR